MVFGITREFWSVEHMELFVPVGKFKKHVIEKYLFRGTIKTNYVLTVFFLVRKAFFLIRC